MTVAVSPPRPAPRGLARFSSRRAMISPAVDLLCIGGASLIVSVLLLAFGRAPYLAHVHSLVPYLLTVAVTWPHFLSSYRLLYASRESALAHPVAAIYFPIALAAYGLFAVAQSIHTPVHVQALAVIAGVYLARHYTGQTWGMMATFSHVEGVPFAARERTILQWALHLMMGWHAAWALVRLLGPLAPALEPALAWVDSRIDVIAFASVALAGYGLVAMGRRIGAVPPARILVPLAAMYGWYALLRRDPTSIVIVQVSHALQYLIFPLRIEENRRRQVAGAAGAGARGTMNVGRAATWLVGLTVVGLAVFAGIPTLFRICYSDTAAGAGELEAAFTSMFVSFVNIHHYFVDGCLYKLRNPSVRRDMFAHLAPPSPAAPPAPAAPAS